MVLLLVFFVVLGVLLGRPDAGNAPAEPLQPLVEERQRADASPVAGDEPAPDPGRNSPVPCKEQQLELTLDGASRMACFGTMNTVQNGSVRSYRIETVQAPRRWLRIDAVGSTVLAAALGSGAAPDFQCENDDCKGISIGRRNADGVRVISLNRAALMPVIADETASPDDAARVSGELKTLPEYLLPGLACTDQGVSIITSDGSTTSFCPKGGAGFEISNEGDRTYRFTSLDGESILVGVDQDHRVRQVEYHGESRLACSGFACGVQVAAPNAAGERRFTFAGSTLIETSKGDRNAVVNGTLIVPPL